MRRIGFQPASKEHKSAVDGVTKRCFDVISAEGGSGGGGGGSQASVKAEEGDVKPRSATSAGGGGGGGGLALPGLGGVPGSHSTPSSSGTATGNGGGARLPPQPRPPSVGSSSAANGAKKKRRADDVVSSEEEDAESAAAAARRSKSSKNSGATAAATAKKKKKKAKGAEDGEKKAPNPNNPFNRPLRLSKELSQVCQGEVVSASLCFPLRQLARQLMALQIRCRGSKSQRSCGSTSRETSYRIQKTSARSVLSHAVKRPPLAAGVKS